MFPVILAHKLDKDYYGAKWHKQFVTPGRRRAEGIWRRTQEISTKDKSGWTSPDDARRRMIHFIDEYDMVDADDGTVDFSIVNAYLWLTLTLPEAEVTAYDDKVLRQLNTYGWMSTAQDHYELDDLTLTIKRHTSHPEDEKVARAVPEHYRTIEYVIQSKGMTLEERVIDSPWNILNSGIRKQGTRCDNPRILETTKDLPNYFPMQIELAGGASIDLGIPPLNHLHTVYGVTVPEDKSFVFGENDAFLTDLIADPVDFYRKAGEAYKTCILAEPNNFYLMLRDMYDKGQLVGDAITNNFDGMPSLVGIHEKYVRRYDEPKHFPKIDFHPDAKTLLVIGNHADRRQVQKQARERGMQVVYVDPEMYVDYFGNPVSYPLEDIHEEDLLLHMTAVEFANDLSRYL